jgi:hypothetical protein
MTECAGTDAPRLPRGVMAHSYGQDPADTVASAGCVTAAGKRNFWVGQGQLVVRAMARH